MNNILAVALWQASRSAGEDVPLHIGINARFLQYPATGSGQNLLHLASSLRDLDSQNSYVLLTPSGAAPLTSSTDLPELSSRLAGAALHRPLAERAQRLWWEQVGIVQACRGQRVDLLHVPYFSAPYALPAPTIVTVHDVIPLILPQYRERTLSRMYTALVSFTVRRADAIIAVSECSKRDIARTLRIPLERIHVIGNAVDESYHPTTDPHHRESVRQRYGIPERYILYLGSFELRKNLDRLLQAYASLPSSLRTDYPLVLAGRLHLLGHPLYPDPRPTARKLGIDEQVVLTGEVREEDKPGLYSGATLFVYPSLYEGFGLPVLEAMACGAPVITSNSSSLPEVAGDAACLIDPTDTGALTEALARLLEDHRARDELSQRALQRAGQFRWDRVAEQTLRLYRLVAQ